MSDTGSGAAKIWYQSFVDPLGQKPYIDRLQQTLNDIASPGFTFEVHGLSPPDQFFHPLTEPLRALPYDADDLHVTMRVLGRLAGEHRMREALVVAGVLVPATGGLGPGDDLTAPFLPAGLLLQPLGLQALQPLDALQRRGLLLPGLGRRHQLLLVNDDDSSDSLVR